MTLSGWGAGPWGSSPWGTGAADLTLLSALAIRENVVRLTFSAPIYFSELLDPHDASDPERYSLVADTSTVGLDGLVARQVAPALAEVAGAGGSLIDLYSDRPFSPYPAVYRVSANNVRDLTGMVILAGSASALFYGLQAGYEPAQKTPAQKDFANPQSGLTILGVNGVALTDAMLGSYVADASGDYASDAGVVSLKKRLLRRILARKGRFAHLPAYGCSLLDRVKELASARVRGDLRAEIEQQAKEEPEVVGASCEIFQHPTARGTWVVRVRVKTKFGEDSVELGLAP